MEKFTIEKIQTTYSELLKEYDLLKDKSKILKSKTLTDLLSSIKDQPDDKKAIFGQEANRLRGLLQEKIKHQDENQVYEIYDVSAPFQVNSQKSDLPHLLTADCGSIHPINIELNKIIEIFSLMGFEVEESLELDDDFHMFDSLNFPKGHPARDDYDNFVTEEKDHHDQPFISPAHTSSMQHRILKQNVAELEKNPLAKIIVGRVFRNENVDARHEHTFYQLEGIYVDKNVSVGNLISTLETFLSTYYGKKLEIHTQPSYFPFTEPSFEFVMSCPYCDARGCHICSQTGLIEIIGCGMIHPNVLKMAGIDPTIYNGFAWGGGIDRLVMMKYSIEDVRNFESGKLAFLRQFK